MEFTKSEIIAEFWDRGILNYKLHAGQLAIENAYQRTTTKLFVGDCSRQLGKSTWAVKICIEKALKKKGARIRYATALLTDLEQFILPAFDFILADCPAHLAPKYKVQKSEFVFPNGSRIRLVGLDKKPNGLRGNRLDLAVLDESGYINRLGYIYKFVLIPATTHVPDAKIIMISTQPETPDHEFVEFCDRAELEGGYVKLIVYDNPLLLKPQIDELAREVGGYDSTAFKREYLCKRIVEEGRALVPDFDEQRHVVESPKDPYDRFYHRLESLDSGVRDQTAALFAYYDFLRAKLCIENEFTIKGPEVTTRRIAELVREKEKEVNYSNVYKRTADNDNLILIQDLGTEFKLYFSPTSKDELEAMLNKVRIWFQNGRVEIHPRCKRLISALKAGIWNKNRTEFARSEVHGHFDIIAALMYLVRNVPESDNPIPTAWGVDMANNLFIQRGKGMSDDAKALRQALLGR